MTAPSTLPDLLPCPFCGTSPVIDGKSDDVRIRCEGCCTQGPSEYFDSDDEDSIAAAEGRAVEKWNRRAHPTPPLRQEACDAAASERKLLAQSLRDAIHEALSEAEGAAQNGSLAAQRASEAAAEIWPLLDRLAASPAAALGGEAQPEVPDERSAEFTDCVLVENCARTSPAPAPHAGRETTGQDEKELSPLESELLHLVNEMLELSDNWPGIAYAADLESRVRSAINAATATPGAKP